MYSILEQAAELIEERRETLARYYVKEKDLINAQVTNLATKKIIHDIKPNFYYQRGTLVKSIHSILEYDLSVEEIRIYWTNLFLNIVWNKTGTSLNVEKASRVRFNILTLVQNMIDTLSVFHTITIDNFWRKSIQYLDTLDWNNLKIYKDILIDILLSCRIAAVNFTKCNYDALFTVIEQGADQVINHLDYNYIVYINSVLFRNKNKISNYFLKRTPAFDSKLWDVVWNPTTTTQTQDLVNFAKEVLTTIIFEQISLLIAQTILFECNIRLPRAIYELYENNEDEKPSLRSIIEFSDYVSYNLLNIILSHLQTNIETNILNNTSIRTFPQLNNLLNQYNLTSIYNNIESQFHLHLFPILCGYWCGGSSDISTKENVVDKLIFSSNSISTLSSTLNKLKDNMSSLNTINNSYLIGGMTNVYLKEIEKFTYTTEQFALISQELSLPLIKSNNIESLNLGYICGGKKENNERINNVFCLNFANDTFLDKNITLSQNKSNGMSFSTLTEGYVCGGENNNIINTIEYMSFDTESFFTLIQVLASELKDGAMVGNNSKGYMCGGVTSVQPVSSIISINFNTKTLSTLTITLPYLNYDNASNSSSQNGYIGGGINGNTGLRSDNINQLSFESETIAPLSISLSIARDKLLGINSKKNLIGVNTRINYLEQWDNKNYPVQLYNDIFSAITGVLLDKHVGSYTSLQIKNILNRWYVLLKSGRYKYVDINYLMRLLYNTLKFPHPSIKDIIQYCVKISWWDLEDENILKLTTDLYSIFNPYLITNVQIKDIPRNWQEKCNTIIPQILALLPTTVNDNNTIMSQFNTIVDALISNYQRAQQHKTLIFKQIHTSLINNIETAVTDISKLLVQNALNNAEYQAKVIVNNYITTRGINKMPAHKKARLVQTVYNILTVDDIVSYQESLHYDIREYVNEIWEDVIAERENNNKIHKDISTQLTTTLMHNITTDINFTTLEPRLINILSTKYINLKQKHDILINEPTIENLRAYRTQELNTLISLQKEIIPEVFATVTQHLTSHNVQELISTLVTEKNAVVNDAFFSAAKIEGIVNYTVAKIQNDSNTLNTALTVPPFKPDNTLRKMYDTTWQMKKDTRDFSDQLLQPTNNIKNHISLTTSTLNSSINNVLQTMEMPSYILTQTSNNFINSVNTVNSSLNNIMTSTQTVLSYPGRVINTITNQINTIQQLWSNIFNLPITFANTLNNTIQQTQNSILQLSNTLGIENTPSTTGGLADIPVPGIVEHVRSNVTRCPQS